MLLCSLDRLASVRCFLSFVRVSVRFACSPIVVLDIVACGCQGINIFRDTIDHTSLMYSFEAYSIHSISPLSLLIEVHCKLRCIRLTVVFRLMTNMHALVVL